MKELITIGRNSHNGIVLDNIAVSAERAVIVTVLNGPYLEGLNSTNGTQINGRHKLVVCDKYCQLIVRNCSLSLFF